MGSDMDFSSDEDIPILSDFTHLENFKWVELPTISTLLQWTNHT